MKHQPGRFCWIDLSTSDLAAAQKFYGALFDWTFVPAPGGHNALAKRDDQAVAALVQMQETKPEWHAYVAVESADATAKKAASLGAKIEGPPFDVLELGRIAVLRDPGNAALPLWQAKSHDGAERLKQPGAMAWTELYTRDVEQAARFYGDLFGWTARQVHVDPQTPYTFFEGPNGEKDQIAGMMKIDPSWGPMPPWWCVHFQVENCAASAKTLERLGGEVGKAPFEIPNIGRLARVSDPMGAAFALFEPKK